MSRNLRLLLFVIGIAILVGSLAALAYAYWPMAIFHEQVTLAPTLFAPP